jgi:phosphatidylcholine synthase
LVLPKRKRRLRPPGRGRPDAIRRLLAWGVHLYTSMGLVAAAGMAVLIVRGGPHDFHRVFLLMLVATLIDATDGALARRVRVKEVLPGFDGRRLDDLTDFLTYTFLPLLLLWRADILPAGQGWWLLLPLLASAYGFSQVCAKTPDGYFLGFPSYWNLVAFYLYVLRPPAWVVISILVVFAFLTFVPLRYLYPSQGGRLNRLTNLLGAVWTALLIGILLNPAAHEFPGEVARGLTLLSLAFPIYYLAASWVISLRLWRRARAREEMQEAPYPV